MRALYVTNGITNVLNKMGVSNENPLDCEFLKVDSFTVIVFNLKKNVPNIQECWPARAPFLK